MIETNFENQNGTNRMDNSHESNKTTDSKKCALSRVATLILIYKIEDSYTVPSMRLFLDFQQYKLNVRKYSRPDLGSYWTFENE